MTKKKWTAAEDSYLKLALKEGLSASEVARNLGRNRNSVSGRKVILGLPGRFSRCTKESIEMIKAVNQARSTRSTKKSPVTLPSNNDSFDLETGYEVPARFSQNMIERQRIANTFEKMQPGQSFAIEGNLVYLVRTVAKEQFESYKIKIVSTDLEKRFARVYRIL
jgi:hypothetical protein